MDLCWRVMINGGMGVIEEGKLKGRKFIIPAEVLIESGVFINGVPKFVKGCLKHERLDLPDNGCPECKGIIK